jgi:hypothetical protein
MTPALLLVGIPALVFCAWLAARPIQNGSFSKLWGAPDDKDVPAWMRDDDDALADELGDPPATSGRPDSQQGKKGGAKERRGSW